MSKQPEPQASFSNPSNKAALSRDTYHQLLSTSWPRFFALVTLTYIVVNLLFAMAYFFCGEGSLEGLRNSSTLERFSDCFFFSVQTLATIGYGRISPASLLPNIFVAIEALVGLLGLALITGLFFSRFSRPTARVIFSKIAVIREMQGQSVLMFRMANERMNNIVEAHIDVALVKTECLADGEKFRNLVDLKLKRQRTPMFANTWTVIHPIDADSPLSGRSHKDLENLEAEIIVSLSGLDETFAQTIHARTTYRPNQIEWNSKFADMLFRVDGKIKVDLSKIHELAS